MTVIGSEAENRSPLSYDAKKAPYWDGISKSFQEYKDQVENWLLFTALDETKRDLAMIARLTNGPAQIAMTISTKDKITKEGSTKMLAELQKVHKKSDRAELSMHSQKLISHRRTDEDITVVISEFLNRSVRVRAAGVKLPDELLVEILIG